jgi:hypothetical protein
MSFRGLVGKQGFVCSTRDNLKVDPDLCEQLASTR